MAKLTRRSFIETAALSAAFSVLTFLHLPAVAETVKRVVARRETGQYAILAFTDKTFNIEVEVFSRVPNIIAREFVNKYGVREDISGLTFVKIGVYNEPSVYASSMPQPSIVGSSLAQFAAMIVVVCRDGKVTQIRKNRWLPGGEFADPAHLDRVMIPKILHTVATKTLLPVRGKLSEPNSGWIDVV